ncbi:MAG: hypothetical protein AB7K24_22700 [Gemmataceae bacterium]
MENPLAGVIGDCDAPPFDVVVASRDVGFDRPADFRWCRMRPRPQASVWLPESIRNWLRLRAQKRCSTCAEDCPDLKRCVFDRAGQLFSYVMGQCPRCHTIYWDEA